MTTLGPGVLKIGSVGTEIDVSCNVNGAKITMSKDQGDSKTMLCGTVKPGSVTYSFALSGNIDIDLEAADAGLFALSQVSPGTQQDFTFTPNNDEGTTASGKLIIDPLDFGADEYGSDLSSDFEFAIVDKPTYVYGGGGGAPIAATGATAGTPGNFTPSGATVPANLAALQGASPAVVASPTTAWTTGQNVALGTGTAHWDGAAYAAGAAS